METSQKALIVIGVIIGLGVVGRTVTKSLVPVRKEAKEYFSHLKNPTYQDLIDVYKKNGYPEIAEKIQSGQQAYYKIQKKAAGEKVSSLSRLGGLPTLSRDFVWPKHKGKSLSFIAQIDLTELPDAECRKLLPEKGLLYFFYSSEQDTWGFDPKDKGGWQIIYKEKPPAADNLIKEFPKDIIEFARFKEVKIALSAAVCPPAFDDLNLDPKMPEDKSDEIFDIYYEFRGDTSGHRLLGRATPVQNPMELECQLASNGVYCGGPEGYNSKKAKELETGQKDWRLLLQIDSDENAKMMWGDSGMIYYWIKKEDLKNKNFDKSWMILQCY